MKPLTYTKLFSGGRNDFLNDRKIRLKMIITKGLSVLMMLFFSVSSLIAEEKDTVSNNFNLDLHLKNMHLWQGFVVTPGVMMASSMEYVTDDNKFVAGLWGGASFDGSYKEFSYYTTCRFTDRFYTQLISHNNYSDVENPDMFSYDKYTSPNFLDIVFSYTISNNVPLSMMWSTILFGQGGDFEVHDDGTDTNSYSTYVELVYPLFKDHNTKLSAYVGGAFAFGTEKTFYSDNAAIVNLGLNMTQDVTLFSKSIPISGTAFWNPDSGVGALQVDIMLF